MKLVLCPPLAVEASIHLWIYETKGWREMKGLDTFKFEKSTQALDFSFWKSRNNFLLVLIIGIITFIAYIPNLHNGFVNWDDSANIYENFYILKISTWSDLVTYFGGIFTSTVIGNYNPLSIFSFALEKLTYGLNNPGWWHLDNIVLHLICVILILRISFSLGLKLIPAAFCALLFGIHPRRMFCMGCFSYSPYIITSNLSCLLPESTIHL
ncbi:MAG: hypothetical protein P8016_16535 [Sedimentisphaerales bacterium]